MHWWSPNWILPSAFVQDGVLKKSAQVQGVFLTGSTYSSHLKGERATFIAHYLRCPQKKNADGDELFLTTASGVEIFRQSSYFKLT